MNEKALEMATLALAHEARWKNETAGFQLEDAETLARIALTAAAPFMDEVVELRRAAAVADPGRTDDVRGVAL